MIGSKGLADSKSAAVANVRPPIELTTAKMNVDKKQSEATKDVDNRLDIKTILTQKFLISYSVSYYEIWSALTKPPIAGRKPRNSVEARRSAARNLHIFGSCSAHWELRVAATSS